MLMACVAHQNLPVGTPQIVISNAATIIARYPLLGLLSARVSSAWVFMVSFARVFAIMEMGFRVSVTLSSNLGISYIFDRICPEPLVRPALVSRLHRSRQLRILGDDCFLSTAETTLASTLEVERAMKLADAAFAMK